MYAAIIRKQLKVPGKKSKPFLNYLAYILAGSTGLGFAGWTYYKRETPSNAGLERIKSHWLTGKAISDLLMPKSMYISPTMSAEARKLRDATEKVYEVYQENHGNLEEKQE